MGEQTSGVVVAGDDGVVAVGEEADVTDVGGEKKSRIVDPWISQYADGVGLSIEAAQKQLISFGFNPQSVGLC